jgi:hypothetical protein
MTVGQKSNDPPTQATHGGVPAEFAIDASSLEKAIDELTNLEAPPAGSQGLRWNWTPLLRALKPHLQRQPPELSFIILIASRQSTAQLNDAKAVLRHFLDRHGLSGTTLLHVVNQDFEKVEDVSSVMLHAVVRLLREQGIAPSQIAIDLTGGQKLTSVAAAISTLNHQSVLQYVQTNPPYEVDLYDLRFDHVPHRE